MKYNSFCNGVSYDKKTLKAIYLALIEYNKRYPEKPRDLTVFKDYDFYE